MGTRLIAACCAAVGAGGRTGRTQDRWTRLAEQYVKLVLALGQHDRGLRGRLLRAAGVEAGGRIVGDSLDAIAAKAAALAATLDGAARAGATRWTGCGCATSSARSSALGARVRMLKGERLSFDEESRALYDAVAPTLPESHFQAILDRLETRFPGGGAARRSLRRVAARLRHPARPARCGIPARDPGLPRTHAEPRRAPAGRDVHGRVRDEQVVERLQLVPGGIQEPHPGEHGSADLHRSRDRSRPATRAIPAITSTTCCSRRTSCGTAAGSSSRSIRCSRRSR